MTTTPVVWLTHKLVGEFIERANNRYEQVNGAGPGWSAANWTGELVLETYTIGVLGARKPITCYDARPCSCMRPPESCRQWRLEDGLIDSWTRGIRGPEIQAEMRPRSFCSARHKCAEVSLRRGGRDQQQVEAFGPCRLDPSLRPPRWFSATGSECARISTPAVRTT